MKDEEELGVLGGEPLAGWHSQPRRMRREGELWKLEEALQVRVGQELLGRQGELRSILSLKYSIVFHYVI